MAGVTSAPTLQEIKRANQGLADLLQHVQRSLAEGSPFADEDRKALTYLLSTMASISKNAPALRRTQPELAEPLAEYESHLLELKSTIERIMMTLLGQRAGLEERRMRVDAAARWCDRYGSTR